MTAAGDPRRDEREAALRSVWIPTLGDAGADPGWKGLSPDVTYKPAGDAIPKTVREGTLSSTPTLGDAAAEQPIPRTERDAGGTLSGGKTAGGGAAASDAGPTREAAAALAGRGYEIIEEIGRGGMGVVFRARQRSLARDVAVKLAGRGAAGSGARDQFVAEALVNGLLDHPNIVPVHELGGDEDGGSEIFLAMKLVGGTSWKDLLHPATARHRELAAAYDLEKHLAILQSVGNAIAFAHSKGIVHRDLKPENVMVGAFGEVLVMDWGIAVDVSEKRAAGDAPPRARHKSTVKAPSGTPSYMPPELAEGRGAEIGPWTDTYLLGAILHEILTGRPPHRGETLLAVLLAASESAPPAFPKGTPPDLAAACAKALSRAPRDRFRSVADFQKALDDYARHRESRKVSESAAVALARAEKAPARDEAARARRYGDFAESVAAYKQARLLWDESPEARDGERAARLSFARAALEAGDVVLAQSQLDSLPPADDAAGALRAELERVHASREKARAMARRLKVTIVAGTAALFVILAGALLVVTLDQLRGARLLSEQVARQRDLDGRLAVAEADSLARLGLSGRPDPEALFLAEGGLEPAPPAADAAALLARFGFEGDSAAQPLSYSSASRRLLVYEEEGRQLSVLAAGGAARPLRVDVPGAAAPCGALSEDGGHVVAAAEGGGVSLWTIAGDGDDADFVNSIAEAAPPDVAAVGSGGKTVACAFGSEVRLYDLVAGERRGEAVRCDGRVARLAFRDGALFVASRSDDGSAVVLRCDPGTGAVLRRVTLTAAAR